LEEKVPSANFSVKEKDEASLSNCFRQDSLKPSFSDLPGSEGFLLGVCSEFRL